MIQLCTCTPNHVPLSDSKYTVTYRRQKISKRIEREEVWKPSRYSAKNAQIIQLSDVDVEELRVSQPGWRGVHLSVKDREELAKLHLTKDPVFLGTLRTFVQVKFSLDATVGDEGTRLVPIFRSFD